MRRIGMLYLVITLLLLATCSTHAAIVPVKNMSVGGYSSMAYFSSGAFSINNTGGAVTVKMYGDTAYNYQITTSSLTFSSCNLLADTSSGGSASGTFDGSSATLTIVGSIKDKVTKNVLATGTLLIASMTQPTWSLAETTPGDGTTLASGAMNFMPTGGLLYTGGVVEGSNTFEIGNFALSLMLPTTGITDFQGSGYSAVPPAMQMTASPVPEPATLAILGFGGMLLARKKIS